MDAPAFIRKPCCVCDAPGGQHCTKCKSRHYCGKACQLVDWYERGHKAQCKQLAAEFQDRLLDVLMPAKLKVKEEPPIVEDVLLADGSTAARFSAARTTATAEVKASAATGVKLEWSGTCAICLDALPHQSEGLQFYSCCCETICAPCAGKCMEYDTRCPLCRAPANTSDAEWLRRMKKHADEGNTKAQVQLGEAYRLGAMRLKKSSKRAIPFFQAAAAQGHSIGQYLLGQSYCNGQGAKINFKTAAKWYRLAAEQGLPAAQLNLGALSYYGQGVPQSFEEAAEWFRLAADQGDREAIFKLGACYEFGDGVPEDFAEAWRLYKRAAAKGYAPAVAKVE